MYLRDLKLWNFRKFGSDQQLERNMENLSVSFSSGVNLIVGQNDSGKTAIIDAIKLLLHTHSGEWIKVEHDDFYLNKPVFRIECSFNELHEDEAKNFIEWLSWEGEGEHLSPILKLSLEVERVGDKILPFEVKAGADNEGYSLNAEARAYLKATYLRPLRDAKSELTPKRNSRLSQILMSHEAFRNRAVHHEFVGSVRALNDGIEKYFKGQNIDETPHADQGGRLLKDTIDSYLNKFSNRASKFQMNDSSLKSILESLSLLFEEEVNLGLGSHNVLVIASELLHLQKTDWTGLRLGLIEEIEAHLHPQTQLRVMETLQQEAIVAGIQLIFTTHSPNITSKIKLENLTVCRDGQAFGMGNNKTMLKPTDYTFLERFLDVTKANLFFAQSLILVEGWAEEQVIPALAKKIGIDLTKEGVSIVNVGSTALLRYRNIFLRSGPERMGLKVAVITDLDVLPLEAEPKKTIRNERNEEESVAMTVAEIEVKRVEQLAAKTTKYSDQNCRGFISPYWTLEYCIAKSVKLRQLFYKAVLLALKEQKEDDGVANLETYNTAIQNVHTHFNNWQEPTEAIAYSIMKHILTGENVVGVAKMKISKAIIAQNFASLLMNDNAIVELDTEVSISYLLNAIRYVASN